MAEKNECNEDINIRLQKITEVIQSIAGGNFTAKAEVTSKADLIDALAVGINMLAEELEDGTVGLEYVNNRIDEIIEVVQYCARGDYGYCKISENNDGFDALCMGLNMMIDDIRSSHEKDKKRVDELQLANSELKSTQKAYLNIMEDQDRQADELAVINKQLQHEISVREQTENERKNALTELERSNKELELFAYVASHDLQEPLRMVSGYLQLLERRYKDKLDDDADEFIAFAVDGASRMQKLINDLLVYSRVTTKGKEFEPTNSEDILDQTLSNLGLMIEDAGASVTHDKMPLLKADDIQLGQVFQNLIGNAIKFHGEESPKVHVSAEKKDNEWLFSIKDNGIGIDPEFSERAFMIFQRENPYGEVPGSGIGLAVIKRIVERHKGNIWFESEPGKGTTFYFSIPIEDLEGEMNG